MKERSKRIVRRWMSTVLIVTMLFACVINDISLPYISWARETASASDARNKRVTLVKSKSQEDVQITILSDEQSYEGGDDICLELVITNNSDGEIKDGLLKYSDKSSSGIEADTAYFEDINDAYVQAAQVIQTGKNQENKADESSKASETETTEESEPEGTAAEETEPETDEPETAAPAEDEGEVETTEPENKDEEEKQEVNDEESALAAEENNEDDRDNDEYPQYLSELNIGPGESYHVNFYYTVDPDIEKIAAKGIEFTFRGIKETEDEEAEEVKEERVNASAKFLYTVNAMNLLPVVFTGDEEGKLIRGEEAEMTLDFSLGNLEEILDEWAMENESEEVASPSNGSTDNAASPSDSSTAEAKKASDSNATGNTVGVTDSLIKWEGDRTSSDKDEKPIVQKLHCEVEIPGVQLDDFMVTDDTADGDDYNTSAVCRFQIGRKTKPGTYYGEVKATYEVKDGKRRASGKSTQGIVLVVSQTKDEQVLEVIRLIDELPESNEVMEKMTAFEEAEDDEAWEAYYMELSDQVQMAYTQYSYLSDEQKEMVDNSEKLLGYVELFGVTPLIERTTNNGLEPIESADTDGLIEVNLYDYCGEGVNTYYTQDNSKRYPGFQYPGGTKSLKNPDGSRKNYTNFTKYNYNFGDNIVTDNWGITEVTNKGGNINASVNGANSPLSGALSLHADEDGYPVLSEGNISLDYLFKDNGTTVIKKGSNINGLFLYDEETGAYTFNSRENHAQFNESENKFELYDQIITPNFIMYPFGNFLPFQDINTQCQQTSTINKAYFDNMITSAKAKSSNNTSYAQLATVLTDFRDAVVAVKGSNWTGANLMNDYFSKSGINKSFDANTTYPIVDVKTGKPKANRPLLKNLYSIDYDEPTNFFFGMEMEMYFRQPKDGYTGKSGKELMEFYFTGDDDVMVYIDDILFLDLSGIHRHVGGKIDFVNGKVFYYNFNLNTGDVSEKDKPDKVVTFEEILRGAGKTDAEIDKILKKPKATENVRTTFKDFSEHKFKFYYMERGSGSGVCRMNFNFPLLRNLSIGKELSTFNGGDINSILGNTDFQFQVLKEGGNEPFIKDTEYEVYENDEPILDANGNPVKKSVGSDGVIKIKGGQEARFSNISGDTGQRYFVRELLSQDIVNQYGQVIVDGKVSVASKDDIQIGMDTFSGYDSPVKNIAKGNSTKFSFNNSIIFNNLNTLEISKSWQPIQIPNEIPEFYFEVILDEEKLPEGTPYVVISNSAEQGSQSVETPKTVATEGIISLRPGETARISNIIAGCKYKIKEVIPNGEDFSDNITDYVVDYKVNGVPVEGNCASGEIKLINGNKTNVQVAINNEEIGTTVLIPIQKKLLNPDGVLHEYQFELVQTTDENGKFDTEGGTQQKITVKVGNETGSEKFELKYPARELKPGVNTYYYRIKEIEDQSNTTLFDKTVYIVKVDITKENGQLRSKKSYKKDGETEFSPWIKEIPIIFANTLLRELVIKKELNGETKPDKDFKFNLTIKNGDTLVTDSSYSAQFVDKDGNKTSQTVVIDVNGNAEITLKHNEELHVYLPYNAQGQTWTVTETSTAGYSVSYKIEGAPASGTVENGKTATGVLIDVSQIVTFINTPGQELPETGGPGTLWYTFGGIVLMAFALMYNTLRRKKVLI